MYNPKSHDAVLGNSQVPNYTNRIVLGGIEGIKQQLCNTSLVVRLEAFSGRHRSLSYL